MRPILVGMLALALAGCGARHPVQWGPPTGWGYKTVQAKEDPTTLIALDESICRVTPTRYQRTHVGERVACHWQSWGGGRPVPDKLRIPRSKRRPTIP
jgi:hypothetical protein